MTPLRREEVTLFCEDAAGAISSRLVEAALQELKKEPELSFAAIVVPKGASSKSDVQVWTKFARSQGYRAMGLRDRDFLLSTLADEARAAAFHVSHEKVKPWPLPRYCIESYLLDEEVLSAELPSLGGGALRTLVDEAASRRRWLDVARATVEDFLWRGRQVERKSIATKPPDKQSAFDAVQDIVESTRAEFNGTAADDLWKKHFEAVAADIESAGPLWCRVHGKELLKDVAHDLASRYPAQVPRGGLQKALERRAQARPPAALLADVRGLLMAVPQGWRKAE